MEAVGRTLPDTEPPGLFYRRWVGLIPQHPNLLLKPRHWYPRHSPEETPPSLARGVGCSPRRKGRPDARTNSVIVFGSDDRVEWIAKEVAIKLGGVFRKEPHYP